MCSGPILIGHSYLCVPEIKEKQRSSIFTRFTELDGTEQPRASAACKAQPSVCLSWALTYGDDLNDPKL